ncbi:MAG: hypothetical protein ACXVE1_15550 [Gaiellaceae bacterium]
MIVGRRHLETVLRIYTALYNRERPSPRTSTAHAALTTAGPQRSGGELKRRDRLGGLSHEYHRAAA